jgi:hypothetical protein
MNLSRRLVILVRTKRPAKWPQGTGILLRWISPCV